MDADKAQDYFEAIQILKSQDCMLQMRMMDYPWMKKDARKVLHAQMKRKAYPRHLNEDKPLSSEDVARNLMRALNG